MLTPFRNQGWEITPSMIALGLSGQDSHKPCPFSSSLFWRWGIQVPTPCRCVGPGPALQMPREQRKACSTQLHAAFRQLCSSDSQVSEWSLWRSEFPPRFWELHSHWQCMGKLDTQNLSSRNNLIQEVPGPCLTQNSCASVS